MDNGKGVWEEFTNYYGEIFSYLVNWNPLCVQRDNFSSLDRKNETRELLKNLSEFLLLKEGELNKKERLEVSEWNCSLNAILEQPDIVVIGGKLWGIFECLRGENGNYNKGKVKFLVDLHNDHLNGKGNNGIPRTIVRIMAKNLIAVYSIKFPLDYYRMNILKRIINTDATIRY